MSNNHDMKGCIEEGQLLLYLKGQLSQQELREVELHLTDCELCSDALEGLRLLKNKDHADEIVTGLKHRINQNLLKNQKPIPPVQQWWQIAAIFIVLFTGIGGYMYIKNFSSMQPTVSESSSSQTPAVETERVPEITSDAKQPEVVEKTGRADETSQPAPQNTNADVQVHDFNTTVESANESSDKDKEELAIESAREMHLEVQDDKYADEEKKSTTDVTTSPPAAAKVEKPTVSQGEVVFSDRSETAARVKKESDDVALMKTVEARGRKQLEEKKYEDALHTFDQLNAAPEENYYKALTYFNMDNYDLSLQHFDKVIKYGRSNFYEDAMWYKANILVKKGNVEEAKKQLSKVISLKGKREKEASDLLKTL